MDYTMVTILSSTDEDPDPRSYVLTDDQVSMRVKTEAERQAKLMKKAISRRDLLSMIGRELECKATYSHCTQKNGRYFALLLQVRV